jgi:hypothetical protein
VSGEHDKMSVKVDQLVPDQLPNAEEVEEDLQTLGSGAVSYSVENSILVRSA